MGMPVIPADISALDRRAFLDAYLGLAYRQLTEVGKRPAQIEPGDRVWAAYARHRAETQAQLADLDERGPAGEWVRHLRAALEKLSLLTHEYLNEFVRLPSVPSSVAISKADLVVLTDAIEKIEKMASALEIPFANAFIVNVFQVKPDLVRNVFKQIPGTLRRILRETVVGTGGVEQGFVLDHGLPRSMVALAVRTGSSSYIRISAAALATPDLDVLVPKLVHEGSHAIEEHSTVDFAYRNKDLHNLLTPELRLGNAANYEQLAINWLSGGPSVWFPGIPSDPKPPAILEDRALGLVQIKATRAWVRAWDLRNATDGDRRDVAELIGAKTGTVGAGLAQAMFDDLYYGADTLMKSVIDGDLTLNSTSRTPVLLNTKPVGKPPERSVQTAPDLAGHALRVLAEDQRERGVTAFPDSLARFVENIQQYDRELLREPLAKFFRFLAGTTS
jgi:hypothetical protein